MIDSKALKKIARQQFFSFTYNSRSRGCSFPQKHARKPFFQGGFTPEVSLYLCRIRFQASLCNLYKAHRHCHEYKNL